MLEFMGVRATHMLTRTTNAKCAAREPSVAKQKRACLPNLLPALEGSLFFVTTNSQHRKVCGIGLPVERTMQSEAWLVRRVKSDTVPSMSSFCEHKAIPQ